MLAPSDDGASNQTRPGQAAVAATDPSALDVTTLRAESGAKRLRIGVIGCGGFAVESIWPCLGYAPIDVAYAFSRDLGKAQAVGRRFGAIRATDRVEDVLVDETVDAVFVIGPPAMQRDIGLAVVESGKHLFVEKPPAPDVAGTRALSTAAASTGVEVQVGFQKRFATGYQLAKARTERPEFGPVRLLKVNYSHWRMPQWHHHLTLLSIHGIDLARSFLGDPTRVHILKRTDPDGFSTLVLIFEYDSNATAVLNLSANDPHVQEWVELSGSGELVSVRNLVDFRHWSPAPAPSDSAGVNAHAVANWHPQFAIPNRPADSRWLQGYAGEVVSFAETLLIGERVKPSIGDALVAMQIAQVVEDAGDGMTSLAFHEIIDEPGCAAATASTRTPHSSTPHASTRHLAEWSGGV